MVKPVGRSGIYKAQVTEDGAVIGAYERIQFPETKEEIEIFIAERFVGAMTKTAVANGMIPLFSGLKPNAQNDFDFTVLTENGLAYLELQEAAPLAGPYETAPASYRPYEYAEYILRKIFEKSDNYPPSGVRDVFLLIYVTHWSFVFSETTINCLRVWLQTKAPMFKAIFTFAPLSNDDGHVQWIFPVPPELRDGFDPESVRNAVCHNLDAAGFETSDSSRVGLSTSILPSPIALKQGRNELCLCGSGQKYKHCHGRLS